MQNHSKAPSSTNILSAIQKRSLPKIKESIKESGLSSKKDKESRRTKAPLRDTRESSGIPRNINYYRHLINDHDSTQDGVEWVLKLRGPAVSNSAQKFEATSAQGFSFSDKTLESQMEKRQVTDIDSKNNLHQLSHLLMHRMGPSPSRGSVQFETGLRSYGSASTALRNLEKNWRATPKKKDLGDSSMYPSYEEMREIRSWTTKNPNIKTHSAFDGHLSFPKYEEFCKSSSKNLAETGHLFSAPQTHMPLVSWQLSMRNYGGTPLKRATSEGKSENSLGELKKVSRRPNRI